MKQFTNLKREIDAILLTLVMALVLSACGRTEANSAVTSEGAKRSDTEKASETGNEANNQDNSTNSADNTNITGDSVAQFDVSSLFGKRDLEQSPDLTDAATVTVADNRTIDITEAGTYILRGTAKECTVRVALSDENGKIQLVLDGLSITNSDFPAIYIVEADKCFITTISDSSLSVTGEFRADGDTNTDAVIFSRDDLTLNGTATLTVNSTKGNGISCKDDLKVTGGTYVMTTALDSFEANDSIAIKDGAFTIVTQKDAFHSENDDDNTLGYIYIAGGTFTIQAKCDGIQGTTFVRIDGGTYQIKSSEGIEATYIEINDGEFYISASDDGLNASRKSRSITTPTIVVNGGHLVIVTGNGDTDALDANGDIYVNGGTIEVTQNGMSSFDYDSKAELNGGTVYINGEQVDTIPRDMFGPGGGNGGHGGPGGGGGRGGRPDQ
ncbi:MAG: carbohydrate-binding domain-containing protein [Lachnospiraceae bacterium]|nr:carbohydrate-binding domain-containing protein [Lachnospiraceae bacterium]